MITYREEKGSPLTIQEMDQNFKELESRIAELESNPLQAEGVASIALKENKLVFIGTHGTDYGSFPLQQLAFKEAWKKNVLYQKGDIVFIQNEGVFAAISDHQSEDFIIEKNKFWRLIFPHLKEDFLIPCCDKESLPKPSLGKMTLLLKEGTLTFLIGGADQWYTLPISPFNAK